MGDVVRVARQRDNRVVRGCTSDCTYLMAPLMVSLISMRQRDGRVVRGCTCAGTLCWPPLIAPLIAPQIAPLIALRLHL